MKQLVFILIILLIGQVCIAQEILPNIKENNKSLTALSDSLVKVEVASFTMKGKSLGLAAPLTEIPIGSCTDKMVHMSIWSTYIHLYFKGNIPDRSLDSIFLVTHSHYWVKFPKDAWADLPQSNSCNFTGTRKQRSFFSRYFKAFYSMDKRRLYIYMQGGTEHKKYEVTWVIINGGYSYRILDEVT